MGNNSELRSVPGVLGKGYGNPALIRIVKLGNAELAARCPMRPWGILVSERGNQPAGYDWLYERRIRCLRRLKEDIKWAFEALVDGTEDGVQWILRRMEGNLPPVTHWMECPLTPMEER